MPAESHCRRSDGARIASSGDLQLQQFPGPVGRSRQSGIPRPQRSQFRGGGAERGLRRAVRLCGEPGPASWGDQVFPRFHTENGDGWAPSTLSLWRDLRRCLRFPMPASTPMRCATCANGSTGRPGRLTSCGGWKWAAFRIGAKAWTAWSTCMTGARRRTPSISGGRSIRRAILRPSIMTRCDAVERPTSGCRLSCRTPNKDQRSSRAAKGGALSGRHPSFFLRNPARYSAGTASPAGLAGSAVLRGALSRESSL